MAKPQAAADELGELFARSHAEMIGKARKLLDIAGIPQCAADADDIVSSAFVEAVKRRDELNHPRAFVYLKIAKKVDELAKKEARRSRLETRRAADPLRCDGPPVAPDLSVLVTDRMRVHVALRDLPEQQRHALWAVEGMGYTRRETADLLGVRPGTVAQHVWRGRVTLQTVLAVIVAILLILIGILTGGVADGGVIASMFPWLDRGDERKRRDKRE
ncbi:sigma-70 family RNA polymerase sigma factor [Streptomyces sp. WMMC500]|uniref:RNA polymerase sigma factor n=1 Tax=Streptomyces sp. WMMC500 TaxID=3015154 RepID=UPI00248B7F69|nr:sigma-70 family RNA polymerase sigma factor [Streptomyces sp. WMMC500]WBB63276.1 sigma-70 family RNA polymerase sigma factor [Streptomyces sp. WMMC500]